MKQHLLLGTALLAAITAFPQNRQYAPQLGVQKIERKATTTAVGVNESKAISPMIGSGQIQGNKQSSPPTNMTWKLISGSANVNGQLVSHSRPLQYNHHLNAVQYIHRASAHYTASPPLPSDALTGIIVAEVSTDWGQTWDSTAIWTDSQHWGRYPQGGIYNPPGNTNINNAYAVGAGVTVGANSFDGNWFASKKLGTYNNIGSTAPGAQQYISFSLGTYPPGQMAQGWSRVGFTTTDDGIVRSMGIVSSNPAGLTNIDGYAITTGTFNNTTSTFDWRIDSLTPVTSVDNTGGKNLIPDGQMAFNQSGTIGYLVGLGHIPSRIKSNIGYQPIIYKMDRTTNANATWTMVPGIDFNSPAMRPVVLSKMANKVGMGGMDTLMNPGGTWDTVGNPYFNDWDIVVDANNKLHIAATLMSGANTDPDSLNFVFTYTTSVNPLETYKWRHTPGQRPYLYDFIGDGMSPWTYRLVDSVASEEPSPASGYPGYVENPWDPFTAGLKVGMDTRIQLGRTPDGEFITFSWAESDSGFTNNAFKWNNLPDLKVRAMAIGSGTNMYVMDQITGSLNNVGPTARQNITKGDPNVGGKATLHYMSPITGSATIIAGNTSYSTDINTPFTITNSVPYSQTTNNGSWYAGGRMSYVFNYKHPIIQPPVDPFISVREVNGDVFPVNIYPNPAHNSASAYMVLNSNSVVEITVINAVGQVVSSKKAQGTAGINNIKFDVNGLAGGIYMVNIKADDLSATKKLIIE